MHPGPAFAPLSPDPKVAMPCLAILAMFESEALFECSRTPTRATVPGPAASRPLAVAQPHPARQPDRLGWRPRPRQEPTQLLRRRAADPRAAHVPLLRATAA